MSGRIQTIAERFFLRSLGMAVIISIIADLAVRRVGPSQNVPLSATLWLDLGLR
jgi:hypothetical protein